MIQNKQHGGTIIGFIIGVVVGLGAALAVAVYVTKVPVPFLNKGQNRTADQDAVEAKKNKNWEPNAPLQGKTPARPAASGAVGSAAPASAPAPAATPAPAPAPKATASAPAAVASAPKPENKPAVSADPLGDLAKARAGATADPFLYFIQVGAYRSPEDAETQRAKLSLIGLEAKVTEREQAGRTVYRVRVGPFNSKDEADKLQQRLESSGLEAALVRTQR